MEEKETPVACMKHLLAGNPVAKSGALPTAEEHDCNADSHLEPEKQINKTENKAQMVRTKKNGREKEERNGELVNPSAEGGKELPRAQEKNWRNDETFPSGSRGSMDDPPTDESNCRRHYI